MWLAFLLISACFAWLFQKWIFSRFWSKGLQVSVTFSTPGIFEGESSTLRETITNRKRLPIVALSVRLAFSRNLEFLRAARENAGVSDQTYKRDIFSLLPMQEITRKLPFVAKKRGYYVIHDADISGYDYFFHKGYYTSFAQDAALYVYPRPVDTRRIRLISRAISGMMLSQNKLFPDPFEFSGIREYHREDPMNRINWKASARAGSLMVNQYDATTEYHVTILLDLDDPYIVKHDALLEESIRIAAGLAAQLVRAKMPVRVLSNCAGNAAPMQSPPNTGADTAAVCCMPLHMEISASSGNLMPLLQSLARLDTEQICISMDKLIASEISEGHSSEIYVVISKNNTQELGASLELLQKTGCLPLIVCPVMNNDTDIPQMVNKIPVLRWELEGR
jgi:uncharacterized protein (DUF58 family)